MKRRRETPMATRLSPGTRGCGCPTASSRRRSPAPRAACGDWASVPATASGCGPPFAPNGCICRPLRPASAHPGQRQSRLPCPRPALRPRSLPRAAAVPARAGPPRQLRADSRRGAARRGPGAGIDRPARKRRVAAHAGRRRGVPGRARDPRGRGQYPVHLRHNRLAEGRASDPPQPGQRRTVHRPEAESHRARPHLHARAALPLFRLRDRGHGGADIGRHAGSPLGAIRPARHARSRAGGALHGALRRAHHVHRGVRASALRRVRSELVAHRRHGRLPLPHRPDEARGERDVLPRGDHLLRPDGELAGDRDVGHRRQPRNPRDHRGPPAARHRDQARRSRNGRDRAGGRTGRTLRAAASPS